MTIYFEIYPLFGAEIILASLAGAVTRRRSDGVGK